jgi:hypothetical protein
MSARRVVLVLALALGVGGCDTLKQCDYLVTPEPNTVVITRNVPIPSEGEALLAHFAEVRLLATRDVGQALLDARVAATSDASASHKLRLATLLTFARESDESEALTLIESVLQDSDPAAKPRKAFATLIYSVLTERRRNRDLYAQLQGRTREGKLEVQAAKAEARALQDRVDALRQQLDALTDIEKSLAANGTGRKPPTSP